MTKTPCATVFLLGDGALSTPLPPFVKRSVAVCQVTSAAIAWVDGRVAVLLIDSADSQALDRASRATREIEAAGYLCAVGLEVRERSHGLMLERLWAVSVRLGCPAIAPVAGAALGDVAQVIAGFACQSDAALEDPVTVPGWGLETRPAAALLGPPAVLAGLEVFADPPGATLLSVGVEATRPEAGRVARGALPESWPVVVSEHPAERGEGGAVAAAFIGG